MKSKRPTHVSPKLRSWERIPHGPIAKRHAYGELRTARLQPIKSKNVRNRVRRWAKRVERRKASQ